YISSTIKSHIIFYKISEDGILEVLRILHQKMD
ncbi:MAG: type II toxin-antitoxin system RelE/ParE family toxin, partial [Bacteroidales bacterium]|nr:type II toxin-antitoxin system RelE/ParE family toxin [Bacteroidales bacterium]